MSATANTAAQAATHRPAEDPALAAIEDAEALGAYLRERRAALDERARGEDGGLALARAYSDLVDGVIRRMLAIACGHAVAGRGNPGACDSVPVAIVATGGYGRRELCPHSDIDITFIPSRDGDALVDRVIKEMFTLLVRVFMDANGMSVGYAYRLLPDCVSLDHQTTSGLLDARLIAGSDRLFIQLEHEFWAAFNPAEFLFGKLEERRRQREKFGSTPRVVEPNLKEGAGGLRDLQSAVWVTQALHSLAASRVRGERALEALTRDAGLTAAEADRLGAAKEFLFRVRSALHVATGAERDQLVVTRQEEIAERLGYAPLAGPDADAVPPVERFMRDLYEHLAVVDRLAGRVLRDAEREKLFLGIGLDCVDREIVPAGPALQFEDPAWMLWACELAQKHRLRFSDALERAIVELLETQPVIRDGAQAGELLARILGSPRGAYPILQKMADLGILGWLVPEFGQTLDLIPYDPSHDYTVGQHTLYVIRHLDALREPGVGSSAPNEELRVYREVMQELPHPEQLYMAALLHDAGKAAGDRPHSEVGEEIAREVCRRLGWSEAATANVCFLIRHHLLMAETSRLRDLSLDETIRDFTAHFIADEVDRLHMLFVLTYADTNAVGAGVWTDVKGRFMRDLLHRAERALTEGAPDEYDSGGLVRTRRRLMKELAVEDLPPEEIAAHVESMPATYLLNTSQGEIALHIGMARRARAGEPTYDFYDERDTTFTEVTVCTLDEPRPGLLAKIAGVFYAADLDVHSAQVVTRVTAGEAGDGSADERIAIDKFFVDFRGRQLTPGKRAEISTNLTDVLCGRLAVADLLAKRRKSAEVGGPVQAVTVRNDLSDTYTVVEVAASDARALLYRTSAALSALGWDIHSARVSLFKGRNMISYYLAGIKGLGDAEARAALLRLMPIETHQATGQEKA